MTIASILRLIVDAKDEHVERFYVKYDFVTVTTDALPHRMFLAISTARAIFEDA